ncbi:MAG TPA: hypothetical protein VFO50_00860 [Candidatus Limnocylindrales bacterium]|nr:hypothetical protein [Candidatus Limnocylindrales bacterium]
MRLIRETIVEASPAYKAILFIAVCTTAAAVLAAMCVAFGWTLHGVSGMEVPLDPAAAGPS